MKLMDFDARMYDPLIGRFVSADSMVPGYENPQALNRYAYALGNPVRYNDPSGHMADAGGAPGGIDKIIIREITTVYAGNIRGTTTTYFPANPRTTVQPVIDATNRGGMAVAWPAAVAGGINNFDRLGKTMYEVGKSTPRSIGTIQIVPPSAILETPSGWAKTATGFSYGLPIASGLLSAREIYFRNNAGEITFEQAYQEQVANAGFASATALGGGTLIPVAAGLTSHPVGWATAGSLALAYDMSVAQGTYNNCVEGQPVNQALLNARTETNRSFGIGWFDTFAYQSMMAVFGQ